MRLVGCAALVPSTERGLGSSLAPFWFRVHDPQRAAFTDRLSVSAKAVA